MIIVEDVIINGVNENRYIMEGAAPEFLFSEVSEPAFDKIEPGRRSWSEMEMETWMTREPSFNYGMLVSCVVVHNDVQIEFGQRLIVDLLEEAYKFLVAMSGHTFTNYLSTKNRKRSK